MDKSEIEVKKLKTKVKEMKDDIASILVLLSKKRK
jgi:hypothetical protein